MWYSQNYQKNSRKKAAEGHSQNKNTREKQLLIHKCADFWYVYFCSRLYIRIWLELRMTVSSKSIALARGDSYCIEWSSCDNKYAASWGKLFYAMLIKAFPAPNFRQAR